MGTVLISKRQMLTAAIVGILLAASLVFVVTQCGKAEAAEPKGEYFAAVSALYQQQLGAGVGVGYQFRKSGIMLLGQLTYTYQDSIGGTTACAIGCRTCGASWSTGDIGTTGFAFTAAFPLRKSKAKK